MPSLRGFLLQIAFLGGAFALGLVACELLFSTNVSPQQQPASPAVVAAKTP